jgi:hypothetical protein
MGSVPVLQGCLTGFQERRGVDHSGEINARHRQPQRQGRAVSQNHGIVLAAEAVEVTGAYFHAAAQVDASGDELLPWARGHSRGENEIWDAPAEQAAGFGLLLVDRYRRAGFEELPRGADPGGSGTHHRHRKPGAAHGVPSRRRYGGMVGDEAFEFANRDGHATRERPGAGPLALGRLIADATTHVRQHRGPAQHLVGHDQVAVEHGADE